MTVIGADNLYLFCTLNCNFNCAHCMRGKSRDEKIRMDVLENLFDSVKYVSVLKLGGGEPLTDLDTLRVILDVIKEKQVAILSLSLTTNGTMFTEEAEKLLDEYSTYISVCREYLEIDHPEEANIKVVLSADEYHEECIKEISFKNPDLAKKYYQNIQRLLGSEYYSAYRMLSGVWDSGNASSLDADKLTIKNYNGFYYEDFDRDIIYTNPILSILPDGTFTEMNGSFDDLETRFNYGNILEDDLSDLIREKFTLCQSYDELYDRMVDEITTVNDGMPVYEYKDRSLVFTKQ